MSARGTSNTNARGGSPERRRRKLWLIETYRADQDVMALQICGEPIDGYPYPVDFGTGAPACRCYRCGKLLTYRTVTIDRIIPGCKGGTYRRDNIRPACGFCNSSTGSKLARRG